MMKSCYNIILVLMYLCISGCAAPQKFYKNTRYTGDIQGHLNNDLAYCHAIAQGLKPTVTPYIPPSPTTTHGSGIITDNHGNVYTGTYRQTTYPNENMALLSGMNNLSRSIQASNIYEAIKTRCLSELGWYEISKEEYLRPQTTSINDNVPRGFIKFSSSPDGAVVYARAYNQLIFRLVSNDTTPLIINLPANSTHWIPECYKAVLDKKESDTICRENEDISREIHFNFK